MNLEVLDGDVGFKVRAGAIAVREGRLLVHAMRNAAFWVTPGGGVSFGETSRDALVREIREEIGAEAQVGPPLWVVEHFFETPRRRWHQILWLHEATLPAACDAVRRDSWAFDDGEGPVTYRWTPLDELKSLPLVPGFLGDALRAPPASTRHLVHVDRLPASTLRDARH